MRKTDASSLLSGPDDHLESFFDVMLHFQSHGFFSDPGECHVHPSSIPELHRTGKLQALFHLFILRMFPISSAATSSESEC